MTIIGIGVKAIRAILGETAKKTPPTASSATAT